MRADKQDFTKRTFGKEFFFGIVFLSYFVGDLSAFAGNPGLGMNAKNSFLLRRDSAQHGQARGLHCEPMMVAVLSRRG